MHSTRCTSQISVLLYDVFRLSVETRGFVGFIRVVAPLIRLFGMTANEGLKANNKHTDLNLCEPVLPTKQTNLCQSTEQTAVVSHICLFEGLHTDYTVYTN